jgi:hypothetical protein
LEKKDFGMPPEDSTPFFKSAYLLRYKPIGDLDDEDLRLLIGQDQGLLYLLPLAIERLKKNPLAEGRFFYGIY